MEMEPSVLLLFLRHWVGGVRRGGGQAVFNQIPVKIRLIRSKTLEIMWFFGGQGVHNRADKQNPVKPQLRTIPFGIVQRRFSPRFNVIFARFEANPCCKANFGLLAFSLVS